ncbi:MFS transporter [Nocardia rhamnosiphila]
MPVSAPAGQGTRPAPVGIDESHSSGGPELRMSAALGCAGVATFSLMYAPQGLLTQIGTEAAVSPSRAALTVSATTLGLALSVLPWAWLSDRIGRSAAMRYAAAAAALTGLLVPWLWTFDLLVAGRFVQGVALGGIPSLAMALVHEVAAPGRAAALAGSYVGATSMGGLAGRVIVVPLAEVIGWRPALAVMGVGVALLMVVLALLLPRTTGRRAASHSTRSLLAAHLRDPVQLALYGIAGLLIGCMVIVFNYLPFRLEAAPYHLAPTLISLIFLAYLAGTVGSPVAGRLADRLGPRVVLVMACALVLGGTALSLARPLAAVLTGVVILTGGMFIGHAVASGAVGIRARAGRAQATALYTIFYYLGASIFGWAGGLAWAHGHWPAVVAVVATLAAAALLLVFVATERRERAEPIGQ